MASRGRLIRTASLMLLVASLAAGAVALPAAGAAHPQAVAAAKKCKKKMPTPYSKKRRCKKKRAVLPASISISPTSEDFGMPSVGNEPTRAFTVANVGGSVSGVPAAVITGPGARSFDIVANTCTTRMSPTAACRIDVKLPFRDPIGPKTATLSVTASPGGSTSAALMGDVEI